MATSPAIRTRVCCSQPIASRHQTATITASTHAASMRSVQRCFVSVPAASPWTTTRTHAAYPDQCSARHVRKPTRWRSQLVIATARRRSKPRAPRPSQIGRYGDERGTTTAIHPIGAKPSTTIVATCSTMKARSNRVTLRCRYSTAKRGHDRLLHRTVVRIPRITDTVRRMSETMPVARAKYQSADELVIATTTPPPPRPATRRCVEPCRRRQRAGSGTRGYATSRVHPHRAPSPPWSRCSRRRNWRRPR